MWCLVASAGTKIRWGKRRTSWAGTCALLKAAQRLEKKAQRLSGCTWCRSSCPRLTLGCLKVSTASMPEVTVLWEQACRRDYVGIDLLGVETDLWALWKFRYQSFWDKLSLPEMCLNLKVKKKIVLLPWGFCRVLLSHDCLSIGSGSQIYAVCQKSHSTVRWLLRVSPCSCVTQIWEHNRSPSREMKSSPTSSSPGRTFDTWVPVLYSASPWPQISFDFQHLITIFRFTLSTSAKDAQASFLNIPSSMTLSDWVNRSPYLAMTEATERLSTLADPCYRPTKNAEMGQRVSRKRWTGRCGRSLLPSWVCFSLQKVLDI